MCAKVFRSYQAGSLTTASLRNVIALEDGGTRRLVPPYATTQLRDYSVSQIADGTDEDTGVGVGAGSLWSETPYDEKW